MSPERIVPLQSLKVVKIKWSFVQSLGNCGAIFMMLKYFSISENFCSLAYFLSCILPLGIQRNSKKWNHQSLKKFLLARFPTPQKLFAFYCGRDSSSSSNPWDHCTWKCVSFSGSSLGNKLFLSFSLSASFSLRLVRFQLSVVEFKEGSNNTQLNQRVR